MPNFVYDDTALFYPKTNLTPIPAGGDPTQFVQALDWNTLNQAVDDIKGVLRGGIFFGFSPQVSDPAPAGIDEYLWLDTSDNLFLHTGGQPGTDTNLSTGGGGSVASASNVNVGGVGVFKQLNGTDLEFKGINAASSKISVVDEVGNNEIDLDVVEANVIHDNLSGAGSVSHALIDAQLPSANQKTDLGQLDGAAQGSVWYADAANRVARLAPGTSGQVLQSGGVSSNPSWTDLVDATAIHTGGVGEINGLADKPSPALADLLVIEDSAAAFAKRKISLSNLPPPQNPLVLQTGNGSASAPSGFASIAVAHGDASAGIGDLTATQAGLGIAHTYSEGAGGDAHLKQYSKGGFAFGYLRSITGQAYVYNTSKGCFAGGYARSQGLGEAYIKTQGLGSHASGYAHGILGAGATSRARVFSQGAGSFARGVAKVTGDLNALASINPTGPGSSAEGYASSTANGEQAQIAASGAGARASGFALGDASFAANGNGSEVGGHINGDGATVAGSINALALGSRAFGAVEKEAASNSSIFASAAAAGGSASGYVDATAANTGQIYSEAKGAFASGFALDGRLGARAEGSHAHGYTKSGSFTATGKGGFVGGYGDNGTATAGKGGFAFGSADYGSILAVADGASAQGDAVGVLSGTAQIAATGINALGASAQGRAWATGAGSSSNILAPERGTRAQGYAKSYSAGDSYIQATQRAAFARGYCRARVSGNAKLQATSHGAFASGHIKAEGALVSSALEATDFGAHALGYVDAGGTGNAFMRASNNGALASGVVSSDNTHQGLLHANGFGSQALGYATTFPGTAPGTVLANSAGSFARGVAASGTTQATKPGGDVGGYNYKGTMSASGYGSFARGCIGWWHAGTAAITSSGYGSWAGGYVKYGTIVSSSYGSFAMGFTDDSGGGPFDILSSAHGSMAFGEADGGDITASGRGSLAFGRAGTGAIAATAENAVQFGPGTNAVADSIQVGSGFFARANGQFGSDPQSVALAASATTFAITSNVVVVTGDVGANTIATITGGVEGEEVTFLFVDALVTITDDNTHTANTVDLSAAFTSADDTVLKLVFINGSWYEVSRSVN